MCVENINLRQIESYKIYYDTNFVVFVLTTNLTNVTNDLLQVTSIKGLRKQMILVKHAIAFKIISTFI